jgi:hypothetical protein
MNLLLQKVHTFRLQILLLGIGLLYLQLLDAILQLSSQTFIYPDSFSYFDAATDLFLHLHGHCYRPIGFAFLTGLPYLFGAKGVVIFSWSIGLNVFFWLGSALILFELAKQYCSAGWAFAVALVYLSCVGPATITQHLLTENCYTFIILVFLFFWDRYQRSNTYLFLALAVSVILFSMLVKPGSKFLAILVLVYSISRIYTHRKAKINWLIYGVLVLIAIQLIGMKAQFGNATLSYIDGITYHNYLCTKAVCLKQGVPYQQINNERAAYLHQFSLPERKRIAADDFKTQLTGNTVNMVKAYLSNLWDNTISGSPYIQDCVNRNAVPSFDKTKELVFGVSKWQNRLFTTAGVLLAIGYLVVYSSAGKSIAMTAIVLLYIVLLSGVSCSQGDRFHLVIYPLTLILAVRFLTDWKQKKALN